MDQAVAIITGAGRGIGRAAAVELSARGYRVGLVSRTAGELEQTAAMVKQSLVVPADVSRSEEVNAAVGRVLEAWGRIDAVVHSAGLAPVVPLAEMDEQQWRAVLDVNLSSAFYMARAVWPAMRRQGGGVLVNLSSLASRDPFAGFGAYGAAKAALNLLGLVLAREGAPIGVRVHTLALGATETSMLRALPMQHLIGPERTMRPQEVARVIALCVTGELCYTSGEVIYLHRQ